MSFSKFDMASFAESEEKEEINPKMESGTFVCPIEDKEIYYQVSNTDLNFAELGATLALKAKHRTVWDFSSGYFVLRMPSKTRTSNSGNPWEYIVLADLDTAIDFFACPKSLADIVDIKAKKLVKEWNRKNGPAEMKGKRFPLNYSNPVNTFRWRSPTRGPERTELRFMVSTFVATNEHQQAGKVKIGISDLHVQMKMKSSAWKIKKEDDLAWDGWGFQAPFKTFQGMLRSDRFAEVIAFGKELATLKEKEQSDRKRPRESDDEESSSSEDGGEDGEHADGDADGDAGGNDGGDHGGAGKEKKKDGEDESHRRAEGGGKDGKKDPPASSGSQAKVKETPSGSLAKGSSATFVAPGDPKRKRKY